MFYKFPNPASLSTPEGVRIDANEALLDLYGKVNKEDWIGTKLEAIYAKEDIPTLKKMLENTRKTGYDSCELTAIRGEGARLPAILNFSTLKDSKGNVTHLIGTCTDANELKNKEKSKSQ